MVGSDLIKFKNGLVEVNEKKTFAKKKFKMKFVDIFRRSIHCLITVNIIQLVVCGTLFNDTFLKLVISKGSF